ncbi:MAG: sugar ABC transporter ATP-binding protein [Solirubrobacteraceae bacterium]
MGRLTSGAEAPLVSVSGVYKQFRGQYALEDVSIDILPATVHAVVGENGAGKSTLGRIIAGSQLPSRGAVTVDGRPVRYRSPALALRDGITMIAQEIALAEDLSVMENVLLGFEPSRAMVLSRRGMRAAFHALTNRTGFELPGSTRVSELSLSKKQEVEILRALARDARLIVMDEPTAALSKEEARKLHGYVRRLRDDGVAVVYVSHFLDDVLELADEITVMRNGRVVETMPSERASHDRLILGMLGKRLDAVFPDKILTRDTSSAILRVLELQATPRHERVSFDLARGEIIGIFGLVGAGRSSLAHAIAGSRRSVGGTVELDGARFKSRGPREMIAAGLALLPESRRDQGLFLSLSQQANVTTASLSRHSTAGIVRTRTLRREAKSILEKVHVEPVRLDGEVAQLSGGNQQKILFAKCLQCQPKVLVLDEPTRGVDIGSKQAIYRLVVDLAAAGTGILFISSELEEITQLAHRVLVMRQGAVQCELAGGEIDADRILAAAFGVAVNGDAMQRA